MDSFLGELHGFLEAALHDVAKKRAAAEHVEQQVEEREAALARGWQEVKEKEEDIARREDAMRLASEKLKVETQTMLEEKDEELAKREKELQRERQKFEDKKEAMMKLGGDKNDIIGLSFGGEKVVKVKRSLLLQVENSMIASMFSGRHDDTLDRDEHGNVFFDYSPKVMYPLIEFLRLSRDLAPQRVPLPEIPQEDELAWMAMVDFMGLKDIFHKQPFMFHGVKMDLPIAELDGWTLVYTDLYSKPTSIDNFIPADVALRGGALLLGARRAGADVLVAAAIGNADVVTAKKRDSTMTQHNGAYWFHDSEKGVGFCPTSDIDSLHCVSWNHQSNDKVVWDGKKESAKHWEKVLFASPFKVPEGLGSA